ISNLSSRIADICADDNPDMAARYSKKALDMKGNHFTVDDIATVNILGISLRKQGKWKEAIREYRRVIEVIPNHAGLLYNMALAYSEGGLFAQALTCLQQALALDPSLPDSGKNIAYNVGKIFEKSGQSGTVFFKKAYALDPNDTTIWEALKRSQAQDSAHEQRTEMAQS
ncbi:MAG: tetratricopeptide repeat protein, partial [Desulfovibrionales bacterium]|nr:tetratricopeptide repeat protein [Desulfovibrionales bacterium]